MLANQDDKGSLQNTHWQSSTSSVLILQNTPAVLSLGKLLGDHGYSLGQLSKTTVDHRGEENAVQNRQVRTSCCPRMVVKLSAGSSPTRLPQDLSSTTPSPARVRSDDTHAQASGNGGDLPKIRKTKLNKGQQSSNGKSIARFPRVDRGDHRKTRRRRSASTRNHSHDSDSERPPGSTVFFSHLERPKLRHLQAKQDYEGSLQDAHW